MKLVEIDLDTLFVFQPKIFYVLDPNQGFVEPVKLDKGRVSTWHSGGEIWEDLNSLEECLWIKKVRIFQLDEEESNE